MKGPKLLWPGVAFAGAFVLGLAGSPAPVIAQQEPAQQEQSAASTEATTTTTEAKGDCTCAGKADLCRCSGSPKEKCACGH